MLRFKARIHVGMLPQEFLGQVLSWNLISSGDGTKSFPVFPAVPPLRRDKMEKNGNDPNLVQLEQLINQPELLPFPFF